MNSISRNYRLGYLLLILLTLMGFSSCPDKSTNPGPNNNNGSTPEFLIGYRGGGDLGASSGLVKVSQSGVATFITNYKPHFMQNNYIDMKNERIAFFCDNPPSGSSCIAYMDIDNISNVKFVPVPESSDPVYIYDVDKERPQVMSDGKILVSVIKSRDGVYENWQEKKLAVYDPKTNLFEMAPSLTPFVLAQPDRGGDTQDGNMHYAFALSPDEKFAVINVYGSSSEGGAYHENTNYMVKYDFATKSYSRIMKGTNSIMFITRDNNYVVANTSGAKYLINVNDGLKSKIDDYDNDNWIGHYGINTGKFFMYWSNADNYTSGIEFFDLSENSSGNFWIKSLIKNSISLKSPYIKLDGAQFSADESKIYFQVSTNMSGYSSPYDFFVYSTPVNITEPNPKPDSLFYMNEYFDSDIFLLLHK